MVADGIGHRGRFAVVQRVIAAHHALQFGELADHAGAEIGLAQARGPGDLALVGVDQRRDIPRQGLDALDAASSRTAGHRRLLARMASGDTFEPGTPDALAAQWITERGGDPLAMSLVLGSFTQTPAAALRPVTVPALVVVGDKDSRGDTAEDLAASLGHGHVARVPGDHGSALLAPELTAEILDFLRHGGPDCFSASAPAG